MDPEERLGVICQSNDQFKGNLNFYFFSNFYVNYKISNIRKLLNTAKSPKKTEI